MCENEFKNNRDGYAKTKDPFIEETIKTALKEWNIKPAGEDYNL